MDPLQKKYHRLQEILRQKGRVAVAFSGGVDSSFLLWSAYQTLGEDAMAITVTGAMVPEEEALKASLFAARYGIGQLLLPVDVFLLPGFYQNPPDRCYHCKRFLFQKIIAEASARGMTVVEGSNVDDLADYRPGRQALLELSVASPLLEAGLTKADIRQLSKEFGLESWDQPSCACLASRIPYGTAITPEALRRIDQAEAYLHSLGVLQVRVRTHGQVARIETDAEGFSLICAARESIAEQLRSLGYGAVSLDLELYRTGRLNGMGVAPKENCIDPVDKI
ncbi:MAG: ATP-dependent sacrificial sulfur transferase LarE [Oscillospiraceae bacterium]|nr:ATP-dependent sacrificial sulfur transferase LarE [Oscillospiraceae bacterium]